MIQTFIPICSSINHSSNKKGHFEAFMYSYYHKYPKQIVPHTASTL